MKKTVLFICVIIASLSLFTHPSHGCWPWMHKESLLPDAPKGDFKLTAKVEVVELKKPLTYDSLGRFVSYSAKAKVIESKSGLPSNQVIHIGIDASACDVPVFQGQVGYIASNKFAIIGDFVSVDITAPLPRSRRPVELQKPPILE
ncbi:MAG TPA: hypothetical protein VJL90_11440 [Pseudorhodoplanes sp.]|nr:hypothetical protein [Pseudorhodoplanes sp.]